jgi:hypothetical protein
MHRRQTCASWVKGTNTTTGSAYSVQGTTEGGLGNDGVFQRDRDVRMKDIRDGSSNTLAIGESSWFDATVGTRYRSWIRGCDSTPVCSGCRNIAVAINVPGWSISDQRRQVRYPRSGPQRMPGSSVHRHSGLR